MFIKLFQRNIFGKTRYFTNCLVNKCMSEITLDADILHDKKSPKQLCCFKCGQKYSILKIRNKKGTECCIDIEMVEAEPPKEE